MAPQFRGAHYAVRSIWWGAEGVKTSTSGFSIFFCEAFPFIQPSRIAIRSSGVRVVGDTTGLRMAARRQGRFLQPWRQLSGTDRTAQILPQPQFPPSAWKMKTSCFPDGALWRDHRCGKYTSSSSPSSHCKDPEEGGRWSHLKQTTAAKHTKYSWIEKPIRQRKLQNPGREKTLKIFPVYYHTYFWV